MNCSPRSRKPPSPPSWTRSMYSSRSGRSVGYFILEEACRGKHINTIFSSSLVIEEMTALLKVRDIDVGRGRTLKLGSDPLAAGHKRLGISFGRLHCMYNRKAPLCRHERDAYPGWVDEFAKTFAEVLPTHYKAYTQAAHHHPSPCWYLVGSDSTASLPIKKHYRINYARYIHPQL